MLFGGLKVSDYIGMAISDLKSSAEYCQPIKACYSSENEKSKTEGSSSVSFTKEEKEQNQWKCKNNMFNFNSSFKTNSNTRTVEDKPKQESCKEKKENHPKNDEKKKEDKSEEKKDIVDIKIPLVNGDKCQYVSQEEYTSIMKNIISSDNVNVEAVVDGINETISKMFKDALETQLNDKSFSNCSPEQIREFMDYVSELLSDVNKEFKNKKKEDDNKVSNNVEEKVEAADTIPAEDVSVVENTDEENSAAFSDIPFGVKDEDPLDDLFGNEIIKKMIEEMMKEKSKGLTPDQYQTISNDPVNPYIAFQNTMEEMQRNAVQNQQHYEYVQTNNPGAAPKKERPIVPKAGGFAVDAPIKKYPPKAEGDDIKADVPIPVVTEPTPIEKESAIIIPPTPLPPAPKQEPDKPRFDNSAIIEKYPYMGKIEEIALNNGIQIDMRFNKGDVKNNNGIILVFAYNGSKVEMEKSFSIDTGVMIDRRIKFYPMACEYGFENINPYYMTDKPPKDKKTKTNGPILKEKMFDDWFKGGEMNLSVGKMYSEDDFELNKLVAMITLPKRDIGNNKEVEEAIRTRLTNAMKAGYLQDILKNIPYGRFKFKEDSVFGTIDKHSKKPITNFTITTENVPQFYAGPLNSRDESIRILGCNRVAEMMFNKDGEAVYSLIDKK